MKIVYISIALLLMIIIASLIYVLIAHLTSYPLIFIIVEIFVGWFTFGSYSIIRSNEKGNLHKSVMNTGTRILIIHKGKEVAKEGYTTFWTAEEYESLTGHL